MIFKTFDNSKEGIKEINNFIEKGKQVFILIFMHGCGPCNATRPEWNNIKDKLEKKYYYNNNIVIVDINKDYLNDIKYIGEIDGFPTMKYISNRGLEVENYEDSLIENKDRTVDSFVKWIESKLNSYNKNNKILKQKQNGGNKSSAYNVLKRLIFIKKRKTKIRKTKTRRKIRRKTRRTIKKKSKKTL